jgi:hypothetical protein
MKSSEFIKEEATGGASCAGGFAAVMTELGGSTKEIVKRQHNYTNQRTPGGVIKGVKAAKVK